MQSYTEREDRMRAVARQLFFMVETEGGRFTLIRTADVPTAVPEERLTLSEAEELLKRGSSAALTEGDSSIYGRRRHPLASVGTLHWTSSDLTPFPHVGDRRRHKWRPWALQR
jgi:hypothetical protein